MSAAPSGYPETDLPEEALGFRVQKYGIRKHWQMFTARQLTAMVTLSDLVQEIDMDVRGDATAAGLAKDEIETYAHTIATFFALAVDRCADFNNCLLLLCH
jgi:putative DNA methylase